MLFLLLASSSMSQTIEVNKSFTETSLWDIISFGEMKDIQFSERTHYFEFTVHNKGSDDQNLVLYNTFPVAELNLLYHRDGKSAVHYGGRFNDSLQDHPFPLPVLKFTAPPGKHSYTIEIKSEGHPVMILPRLASPEAFQDFSRLYLNFLYLIFGGLISNLFYQILYGTIAKRRIVVSYSMTITGVALYLATTTGFVYIFPAPISSWFGANWPIVGLLSVVSGIYFLIEYYDITKAEFPKIMSAIRYYLYSVCLLLLYPWLPPEFAFGHTVLGVTITSSVIYCAVVKLRQGHISALIGLLNFGVLTAILPLQGLIFMVKIEGSEIFQLAILPSAGFVSIILFALGLGFKTREQEENFEYYRSSLEGVVSENMIGAILKNPEKIKTGVTEARITIMFIDMVGYSRIVRKSSPQLVFDEIKSIMAGMKAIVHDHGGIIDKTLGDGLLCSFGSNLFGEHIPHHEQAAIDCAEELQKYMVTRIFSNEEKPVLPIRIGINTDRVYIGNMGDQKNFDFTLTGEGVVLASRFEAACEPFKVICGEETFKGLEQSSKAFNQRLVTVKHERAPRAAYEFDPFFSKPEILERARQAFFHSHDLSNAAKRFVCDAQITIGSSYGHFDIVNFSLGGMAIEGETFIGCQSQIEIQIPDCDLTLEFMMPIQGVVRWGKATGSGTFIHGVSLVGCSQNVKEALVEHFQTLDMARESS